MTTNGMVKATLIRFVFALAAGIASIPASAATSDTVVLVAKRAWQDPLYGRTVIVAKALDDGGHIGLILNRPTKVSLAQLFPEDGPSQKVQDQVYLGGPSSPNMLLALVAGHRNSDQGSLQIAPYINLAVAGENVDHVIQTAPGQARFFMGAVLWQPGELDHELKAGAWHVMNFDPQMIFEKNTSDMWRQLIERAEHEKGIVTVLAGTVHHRG